MILGEFKPLIRCVPDFDNMTTSTPQASGKLILEVPLKLYIPDTSPIDRHIPTDVQEEYKSHIRKLLNGK